MPAARLPERSLRSPIRKERRGERSRSRDRPYSSHSHSRDRAGQYLHEKERREKYDKYQDKYKKGERIERDHYRR